VSKTEENLKIGDLVENVTDGCQRGIVLKKRFSPQDVRGQKYNILTYDILFDDGDIRNLKPTTLRIVQKL